MPGPTQSTTPAGWHVLGYAGVMIAWALGAYLAYRSYQAGPEQAEAARQAFQAGLGLIAGGTVAALALWVVRRMLA